MATYQYCDDPSHEKFTPADAAVRVTVKKGSFVSTPRYWDTCSAHLPIFASLAWTEAMNTVDFYQIVIDKLAHDGD